jgi:hypothetical protein
MRASEIISDVRSELVEASASFWSDAELLALANRAEKDYVKKVRSLTSKAYLSTVAGQQDYPLPSNFLGSLVVFCNVSTDTTPQWVRVNSTNLEKETQMNEDFNSSDSNLRSDPNRYWLVGRNIYFDPIPNVGSSNILMFFKSKPIPMVAASDSINIDDSESEAINEFMLWKAWKKEQEDDKASEHRQLYEECVREGRRAVKLMAGDLRNRLDIDSNRGFDVGNRGFNPFM